MKKLICILLTVALVFSSAATVEAKGHHSDKKDHHNTYEDKHEFNLYDTPVIKYGKYKLPIKPITEGMGAQITYDNCTAVLTIVKGSTTIVIDFKHKTVTVNGVPDTSSGIFKAKNSKKMTVLIYYIAKILGSGCKIDDGNVVIVNPGQNTGLNPPTNITLAPAGTVVIANTLNTTSTHLWVTAKITPGQAAGGRAELYVGSKLAAVDSAISAADNQVTFTTSDGTPTNEELRSWIPSGGVVTIRLYNASGNSVVSTSNPTLAVDYAAPTLTGITSATYNAAANQLTLIVTGAGNYGDLVDVTKLTLIDSALNKSYQLTSDSSGTVTDPNSIIINIGASDKNKLNGYGSSTMYLSVTAGSILKDIAGNTSPYMSAQVFPVYVSNYVPGTSKLDPPTNVTVAPVGTINVNNTINTTTLYVSATAKITPGQAAGGRAELYVGSILAAVDPIISVADNIVSFTTSDGTPTNAKLRSIIPYGGQVTVKLYNSLNNCVISCSGNPTLLVDYTAPTLSSIYSADYNASACRLNIYAAGAGSPGDIVDTTLLSVIDNTTGRSYRLTTGSNGTVVNESTLSVNLNAADKAALSGFTGSGFYLSIAPGSLIKDIAGNISPYSSNAQLIPITGFTSTPQTLYAPTSITILPQGGTVFANTLNSTNLSMDVTANITPGQAVGGKAELYVGTKLIATDSYITAGDNKVSFTTSDGSPTNAKLQALVPSGGTVSVRLYNASNVSVTSSSNPNLTVDYKEPTISGVSSAIYDAVNGQILLMVTGADAVGDQVDVTMISLYDTSLGRTYQLTSESKGTVNSANSITIKLGSADKSGLSGFGYYTVTLTINYGSLLKDIAGNVSPYFGTSTTVPVTIVK